MVRRAKPGTWWIGVFNSSNSREVRNEDILAVASSSTFERPGTRSEAEEMTNFAMWYSFHRTRMKVAKYAASEAFSQLGDNYRVGYDSIWNRKGGSRLYSSKPALSIPTGADADLFTGTNRTCQPSRRVSVIRKRWR